MLKYNVTENLKFFVKLFLPKQGLGGAWSAGRCGEMIRWHDTCTRDDRARVGAASSRCTCNHARRPGRIRQILSVPRDPAPARRTRLPPAACCVSASSACASAPASDARPSTNLLSPTAPRLYLSAPDKGRVICGLSRTSRGKAARKNNFRATGLDIYYYSG